MGNDTFSGKMWSAARYGVARWLCGVFWCLKYAVILPLATMTVMALFVLWKNNTTPGKLLVQEINHVREAAPAGKFLVEECRPVLAGAEEQAVCRYRIAEAAEYARETDQALWQMGSALWVTLALMYMSFAVGTGKLKCVRVATADERLKHVYTEDASLPEIIRKCHLYFPDGRTDKNNGDKNEHA